jgi:hypothetical protein
MNPKTKKTERRKIEPDDMSIHDIAVLFFASAYIIKSNGDSCEPNVVLAKATDMADQYMAMREEE